MIDSTARLARSITWKASKQSFLTACLLADRGLADDCLRAYAYFRWADDMIDCTLTSLSDRCVFIERQSKLIEGLYQGLRPADLTPEEDMLADLIAYDRMPNSGLRSFIDNFMSVIAFDAGRCCRSVTRQELADYTSRLAAAVMDGIQYFIGQRHSYPHNQDRTLAVRGAHITHMLRDLHEDLSAGLVNLPAELLSGRCVEAGDLERYEIRQWVRDQVSIARDYFRRGRVYIDSLQVLRCKLAGIWYCARFECILDAIERDDYHLRSEYPERRSTRAWLNMLRLGLCTTWQHFVNRLHRAVLEPSQPGYSGQFPNQAGTKLTN
jgi:phytoene/squalene synthetase